MRRGYGRARGDDCSVVRSPSTPPAERDIASRRTGGWPRDRSRAHDMTDDGLRAAGPRIDGGPQGTGGHPSPKFSNDRARARADAPSPRCAGAARRRSVLDAAKPLRLGATLKRQSRVAATRARRPVCQRVRLQHRWCDNRAASAAEQGDARLVTTARRTGARTFPRHDGVSDTRMTWRQASSVHLRREIENGN